MNVSISLPTFPEVFLTGAIPSGTSKEDALAWALLGWANVKGGVPVPVPNNLAKGFVELGRFLGIEMTPENCLKLSSNYILGKDKA